MAYVKVGSTVNVLVLSSYNAQPVQGHPAANTKRRDDVTLYIMHVLLITLLKRLKVDAVALNMVTAQTTVESKMLWIWLW